jgi:hypothetical protein
MSIDPSLIIIVAHTHCIVIIRHHPSPFIQHPHVRPATLSAHSEQQSGRQRRLKCGPCDECECIYRKR